MKSIFIVLVEMWGELVGPIVCLIFRLVSLIYVGRRLTIPVLVLVIPERVGTLLNLSWRWLRNSKSTSAI